jgi:hypothetical protein
MSLPTPYTSLANALKERQRIIADRETYQRDPDGHLASLQNISQTIDTYSRQLPAPVDPQLAHYLQRCSFDKALAFIEQNHL